MKKTSLRAAVVVFCVAVIAVGGRGLWAQIFPGSGGPVTHVFSLSTSDSESYSNPSGAMMPMPETSLNFTLTQRSLLTIRFAARGSVAPSGSQIIPITFIGCQIDGAACQPDTNSVEFLYPQFCCDTRSFQGTVDGAAPGAHIVQIEWGMGNPTSADVSNRSLVVEAAPMAATTASGLF
jgi:hypothetical protein